MAFDLTLNGWLNGVSALGVVITAVIMGLYIYFRGRKLEATLLKYSGGMLIFVGLLWSGPALDFLTILTTTKNILYDWRFIYAWVSYIWVAPAITSAIVIGAELIAPNKKKFIVAFIIVVSIIFEIGLLVWPYESYTYPDPYPSGENIIDTSLNFSFFTFYALAIILVTVVAFNGIGSILKARQSTGILKRKFVLLSLGFIIFPLSAVFDTLFSAGALLFVVRMFVVVSGFLIYFGLKP